MRLRSPARTVRLLAATFATVAVVATAPPASAEFGAMHQPATGRVTSKIDWRCSGYSTTHDGIDIANPNAPGVFAAYKGRVRYRGWYNGYGNTIDIEHSNGYWTRYAHLSGFSVAVGDWVTREQRIGTMGNSGTSSGTHLHFEVLRGGQWGSPHMPLNDAYTCGEWITAKTKIQARFPDLPA